MASVTEEIAIKLGIKNADLKAVLADSGAAIKAFKKAGESSADDGLLGTVKKQVRGLNDLKQLLTGGALAGAIKGFYSMAVEHAQKVTDTTDENARAVREFARSFDEIKGVAGGVAVAVIGTLNRIGEAMGDWQNKVDAFWKGGPAAVAEYQRIEKIVESTGRAAEEAERRLAEVRKKNGTELLAITKQLQGIEEKIADAKLKALTPAQQEMELFTRAVKLRDQLNEYEGEAIGRRRLELELAETGLKILDATAAKKKEEADVEKKRIEDQRKGAEQFAKDQDERIKAAEEYSKSVSLSMEEEREFYQLQTKAVKGLTLEERERLKVLELQHEQKRLQVSVTDLLGKLNAGTITTGEKAILAEEEKQLTAVEKKLAAKQAIAAATSKQVTAEQAVVVVLTEELRIQQMLTEEKDRQAQIEKSRSGTVKQTGDVQNLSDVQLEELILKLNREIGSLKAQNPTWQGEGGKKPFEQVLYEQNLQAAIKERNVRRDFANTQRAFGDEGTERRFAPGEYERLSALWNPDLQKQQAKDISNLTRTIANVFPDQFAGLR